MTLQPSIEQSLDQLADQVKAEMSGLRVHRGHAYYLTQTVFYRTFDHDKGQESVVVKVTVENKGTIEIDVCREESGRIFFECPATWDVSSGVPFELPLDMLTKVVLGAIQASASPI